MSGFSKGFRISKARLVNVFRKSFFYATCNAMQGWDEQHVMQFNTGVGEQNDMAWWGGLKQNKKVSLS